MARARRSAPLVFLATLLLVSALPASIPVYFRLSAIAAEVTPGGEPIAVYAREIALFPDDPDRTEVGKLTFLGGLVLTSPDMRFGGYSALLVDKRGNRLIAQSDRANWLSGDIAEERGRIAKISNAVLAPILDAAGHRLTEPYFDSESIVAINGFPGVDGSDVLVGFETRDRIERYALGREGLAARPVPVKMPDDIKDNFPNKGFEGIALLDDRRLLAITERTLDETGNMKGWIVSLETGESFTLSLKRDDPFDLTDLARLPDGDILTLERRYTRIGGPGMRIRRIAKDSIVPGAVLDGEVIAELGPSSAIDNMEGLAVRTDEAGRTLLYVISDDNQKSAQRTVLFQFALGE